MATFADVKSGSKPNEHGHGRFAKGGTEFIFNGIPFMTLATNPTPYNAVNLQTGDLTTMKNYDSVDEIKTRVRD